MNDQNDQGVLQKPSKVIYVGLQGAQIVQVTQDSLDYIDQNQKLCTIDLQECAKNWCTYWDQHQSEFILLGDPAQEEVDAENATTVALRGIRYMQFMDEKRTRFQFANDLERWKLQGALFKFGWRTFDME